jgi:hypothetical protein
MRINTGQTLALDKNTDSFGTNMLWKVPIKIDTHRATDACERLVWLALGTHQGMHSARRTSSYVTATHVFANLLQLDVFEVRHCFLRAPLCSNLPLLRMPRI